MQRKCFFWLIVCLFFVSFSSTTLGCWPKPEDISLTVNKGLNIETVVLTISGNKFAGSVQVKLTKTGQPDIVADNIETISKNQITSSLDLTDKAVGAWDLTIINMNRFLFFTIKKPAIIRNGFTIEYPAPTITDIEPGQSINNSLASVTVNGAHFRIGANVMLSSIKMDIGASKAKVSSGNRIDCEFDLNGASPDTYSLKVVNDDGKSGVLPQAFIIANPSPEAQPTPKPTPEQVPEPTPVVKNPPPVIHKISSTNGINNGSVLLDIEGENFVNGLTVKMSGNETMDIPGVNIKTESTIKFSCFFDLDEKPAGQYNIVVTNPDGQTASLAQSFTIKAFVPDKLNIRLQPVFFDFDKWVLRSDQITSLDVNLEVLKKNPKLYVILGSHADERGSREYNLDLTAKRGEAVKKYLTDRGIGQARFVIYAYGEDHPVNLGQGETTWEYNRRVDVLEWETVLTEEQVLDETNK